MPEQIVERSTVRSLIRILGLLAVMGVAGTFWLVNRTIGMTDPAALTNALMSVAVFSGLIGTLVGAVTTLATNRSGTTATAPQEPAVVPPAPIAPDPAPEAGSGGTSAPSGDVTPTPTATGHQWAATVAATGPGTLGL